MNMNNTISGLALGGLTGATLLLADALTATTLGVRDAVTLVVFVSGLVWWMGRKFQKIEDKLDEHNQRLADLPCGDCEVEQPKSIND